MGACVCTAEAATVLAPPAPVGVAEPAPPPPSKAAPEPSAPPAAEPVAAPEAAPADEGCIAVLEELPGVELLPNENLRTKGSVVAVRKAARRLIVFDDGRATHCFKVALGFAPRGHKQIQGDGKTPEGFYRTTDKPWSSFDNAIAIHYPNEADARAAASDGRISAKTRDRITTEVRAGRVPPQSTKLGGAVLIHGGGSSYDWTLGCVALEDADLVTLRGALPRGMRTNLLILP